MARAGAHDVIPMLPFLLILLPSAAVTFVLARATLAIRPGKGPQGGEVIFLGWCLLMLALAVLSLVTLLSHGLAHADGVFVVLLRLAGALPVLGLLFAGVLALLGRATRDDAHPLRSRPQVLLAAGLVLGVAMLNAACW
jgi:hypothetical protein